MTHFIQIHALTVYPLSNPNRDDTGKPKTAQFGGAPRLRLSSQALKRAIRVSDVMQSRLKGHLGERTQRIGQIALEAISEFELEDARRDEILSEVTDVFGKIDAAVSPVRTRQLAFVSPEEKAAAIELARKAAAGEPLPKTPELKKMILRTADGAADIAMFGRMLADDPEFNRDAAVQVAHAFTTHRAIVEDDFYTAVDDNKQPNEDMGAGFIGEAGFGSGVFYLYACIDRDLLIRNLDNDEALASEAIAAFIEGMATSTPSGKRTSFAHQTRASFLQVEKGTQQPRSLAGAFLKPVALTREGDLLFESIKSLEVHRSALERGYGPSCDADQSMNLIDDQNQASVAELAAFGAE
jgi:CRISPR system Cascade subunit CasC